MICRTQTRGILWLSCLSILAVYGTEGVKTQQYLELVRPLGSAMEESPMGTVGSAYVPYPRKKAAIVLDKLLFTLQKAFEEPHGNPDGLTARHRMHPVSSSLDLQRRGNGNSDNRLYWRCYFNAVSCF